MTTAPGPAGPDGDREFDRQMARAGLSVPDEWRTGTIAAYRELRAQAQLLREVSRPVESEPSTVYRIHGGASDA